MGLLAVILIAALVPIIGSKSKLSSPDVKTATLPALFEYLAAKRGFAKLDAAAQERFADALRERFSAEAPHRELKQALDGCDDAQLKLIQQALEPLAFRRIVTQAREYQSTPREKRHEFLATFDRKSTEETAWLKGHGDPARDLTGRLGAGMPSNPEELYKYLHAHTTPAERQLLEAFVSDLKAYHSAKRAG